MMKTKAAKNLKAQVDGVSEKHLRDVFRDEPDRFQRFSLEAGPLLLDFSKNRVDNQIIDGLVALAEECGVIRQRDLMFSGAAINESENRAVLHTALRAPCDYDRVPFMRDIHAVLQAMTVFSESVRTGETRGATGNAFTDVVNIGIGGSDLGPAMVVSALRPYHDGPRCHFVSNVDGAHLSDTLLTLDPETTLFLVASKTFTTQETMMNARSARLWLEGALGKAAVGDHFAAISTNLTKVTEFGIKPERVFGFWDWVGGRCSVWSAIGLSVMLAVGPSNFRTFLDGAHVMDQHFSQAPLGRNMPVILALLGVWYRNFMGYGSHAILPYDQRLLRFPAYLQQLDMESNGKSVGRDGKTLEAASGPVIWGEPGTNGQHAFYQLIHQGSNVIPCDFLLAACAHEEMGDHHAVLAANCLAQAEALMQGKTLGQVEAELAASGLDVDEITRLAPHKVFPGNRPSNVILYERLDPFALGNLIALYEHKVFVQGVIWGVNSFDQWGVELGKELARALLPMVRGEEEADGKDVSTRSLIDAYHRLRR